MSNPVPQIPDFQVYPVGAAPIVSQSIHKLGLVERIEELSPIKKEDCNISVDIRTATLMINQLTSRRPLYKVDEFYERQDVELLFGLDIKAADFNDDALGQSLDALYASDLKKSLYSNC